MSTLPSLFRVDPLPRYPVVVEVQRDELAVGRWVVVPFMRFPLLVVHGPPLEYVATALRTLIHLRAEMVAPPHLYSPLASAAAVAWAVGLHTAALTPEAIARAVLLVLPLALFTADPFHDYPPL